MKKVILALSICATSALFASDKDYKYEFTPVVGGTLSEHNLGYDKEFLFGARIARNFENSFIDQVELGFDHTVGQSFKWDNRKTDVTRYFVNVVSNLVEFSDDTKLYGLLGLGYEDWAHQLNEKDSAINKGGHNVAKDGGFGQYGLGFKHYWTENFATKLEAKDMIRFRDGSHTMSYTLGFAVDFGRRHAPIGDSDGDGVPDNIDRCPDTPAGVVVDEYGCEKVIRLKLGVNFKFDSAKVSPEYKNEIAKVADFVKDHDDYMIKLEGNTDSIGSEAYNQKLSVKRANAVKSVLVDLGVNPNRITTVGLGESNPIATNATAAGRAENRRVDAKFTK